LVQSPVAHLLDWFS